MDMSVILSSDQYKMLQEAIECPICCEEMKDVQNLQCGHTICGDCLGKLHHRVCPTCKSPLRAVPAYAFRASINAISLVLSETKVVGDAKLMTGSQIDAETKNRQMAEKRGKYLAQDEKKYEDNYLEKRLSAEIINTAPLVEAYGALAAKWNDKVGNSFGTFNELSGSKLETYGPCFTETAHKLFEHFETYKKKLALFYPRERLLNRTIDIHQQTLARATKKKDGKVASKAIKYILQHLDSFTACNDEVNEAVKNLKSTAATFSLVVDSINETVTVRGDKALLKTVGYSVGAGLCAGATVVSAVICPPLVGAFAPGTTALVTMATKSGISANRWRGTGAFICEILDNHHKIIGKATAQVSASIEQLKFALLNLVGDLKADLVEIEMDQVEAFGQIAADRVRDGLNNTLLAEAAKIEGALLVPSGGAYVPVIKC